MKKFGYLVLGTFLVAACSPVSQSITSSSGPSPRVSTPACTLSPIIGDCFEADNQVLLVKIDDVVPARPQVGLNQADLIVVEPVEAGLTRLMAVFNSQFPEIVGPVRSARITDIDIAAAFGSPGFAYSGSTSKLVPYLNDSMLQLIGAPQGGEGYYRDETRYAPHNYLAETRLLLDRIEDKESAKLNVGSSWNFGENARVGKSPTSIEVIWASSSKEFFWNPVTKVWEIWADGQQTFTVTEGGTLEPAVARTVFIQQTNLLDSPFVFSSGTVTPYAETYGSGKGWVLSNGKSYYATWSRPTLNDLPVWRDQAGAEIKFQPGNVWWLVAPYAESTVKVKLPNPKPTSSASSTAAPKS